MIGLLMLTAVSGEIAQPDVIGNAQRPYFDLTVIAAGSVSQMARDAKAAIECGFELVTVRPWKEGDISRPARFISRPMSLIVQAATGSDLNKIVGCFHHKRGTAGAVLS